jgi:hypothetical protein
MPVNGNLVLLDEGEHSASRRQIRGGSRRSRRQPFERFAEPGWLECSEDRQGEDDEGNPVGAGGKLGGFSTPDFAADLAELTSTVKRPINALLDPSSPSGSASSAPQPRERSPGPRRSA